MIQNKATGDKGELLAAEYLSNKGYNILHKNWRHRHWEVDIIASKANRLHFIEVKTRTSNKYGHPEESISFDKMHNLMNAAEEYQYKNRQWKYIQFDAISILMIPDKEVEYFMVEDIY